MAKQARHDKAIARQRAAQMATVAGFDCCIVAATQFQPAAVMEKLGPLLAPSASFAVFHTYQQPLAECMTKLQSGKAAVGLQISESWSRELQVLPLRTHPFMNTSGSGGYILSGTFIEQT